MKDGFTLTELIIVIIVIGILATIGITQYYPTRERALGREAKANLKLISAAEKIYRMEVGTYYPASGNEDDYNLINTNLKLSLTETNWDYEVTGGANTFIATGERQGGPGGYLDCLYTIIQSQDEPTDNGNCPP